MNRQRSRRAQRNASTARAEVSSEEEARNLVVELRVLEGTVETLRSRMNFLNAAFAELNFANRTLEGVGDEEAEAPLFVPIGGGSYVKAKLGEVDKVIYGVGAGVAIERSLEEAKEGIANRVSEIEKSMRSVEQQHVQVLRRIQADQNRLQELTGQLRRRERT
jgi:prefoldin alpha subunit